MYSRSSAAPDVIQLRLSIVTFSDERIVRRLRHRSRCPEAVGRIDIHLRLFLRGFTMSSDRVTDPGLTEFRDGVQKQLGPEDYDTRYNLGIDYREMGLIDEAIAEFQLAAKDEKRALECYSMVGLCFLEKCMPDIAIKLFSKGLELPGRREEEYHGLRYQLAQAFEAAGQPERALAHYQTIYRDNKRFRDVKERVRNTPRSYGGDDLDDDDVGGAATVIPAPRRPPAMGNGGASAPTRRPGSDDD